MEYLIAHRGNINGKSSKENSPLYIDNAIKKGFDVEIDIWYYNEELKLGHDYPKYRIDFEWIIERKESLWVHCKNVLSAEYLSLNPKDINFFFHENDKLTITSKGYLWVFPGEQPVKNSIAVMPEIKNDDIDGCLGVCSDFITKYR